MRFVSALSLALFLFGGAVFGAEPPLTLVSFTGEVVDVSDAEAALYAPITGEEVKELAGDLELLVFTTEKPGVCPACDRARPQWKALVDEYPITPVYCTMSSYPKTRGDVIAMKYEVEAFPTFVLVVRNEDGTADEVDRWRGAGSFWEPTRKRIERAFEEADYQPRVEREGGKVPPREPRPIPGLNPPKPVKVPPKREPPRISPPGVRPGRPRATFGFTVDFDDWGL